MFTLTINVIPQMPKLHHQALGPVRPRGQSPVCCVCPTPTNGERRQSRRKAILSPDNLRQSVSSSTPPTPLPSPPATNHGWESTTSARSAARHRRGAHREQDELLWVRVIGLGYMEL